MKWIYRIIATKMSLHKNFSATLKSCIVVKSEHPEASPEFQETVKRLQAEVGARVEAMHESLDKQKDVVMEKLESRR